MSVINSRLWVMSALLLVTQGARAQFAVIDIASITQMVQQVQTMGAQLEAVRAQLAQAQAQYQALTGNRGMQSLLSGTVRNYLPADWPQLNGVLQQTGSYPTLAAALQSSVNGNAVLSASQLALLTPDERLQIDSARKTIGLLQAVAQGALSNSSGRFAAIQQLIDAIPAARDPKGILDLQARIGAEQGMLQNEQNKLQVLFETAVGQQWATQQQQREQIVAGHGRFATRFEPIAP
jgi:type IV secretion system protein VirB5